ncbi:Signal recognition particle protein [Dinochytrium kinnereticum]|nr:Signal recognition particle protein [Dinochytrium kinnereticum]
MVYFENWDEFQKAVEDLYASAPKRARFLVKYRHCDGDLVLKITDGPSCLKYRTDRQQDLKKFEKLTMSLMLKMQQRKVVVAPPPQVAALPAPTPDSPSIKNATPSAAAAKSSPHTSNQQNKKKKKKR